MRTKHIKTKIGLRLKYMLYAVFVYTITAMAMLSLNTVAAFAEDTYTIATAEDLEAFAELVNNGSTAINAVLSENIDLSNNTSFNPIGNSTNNFCGIFDGNNHKIINLKTIDTTANYIGLFGYIGENGEVKNLTVENGDITGQQYVGGIAGYNNYGTIENCSYLGSIIGKSYYVGGIVGYNSYGTVRNCSNSGSISGSNYVGGITGYNKPTENGIVENCSNTGKIYGSSYIGGIAGDNDGIVKSCYNNGIVEGSSNNVGGIIGYNNLTVANCFNLGSVIGSLTNSYNVGGITGYNRYSDATISNCYNSGSVSSCSQTGGIAGYQYNGSSVNNCYNSGIVSAANNTYVGGITGRGVVSCKVNNSYYLKTNEINANLQVIGNSTGKITSSDAKNEDQFASGEVTYLLNGSINANENPWVQTITKDNFPLLSVFSDSLQVVGFSETVGGNMLYANKVTDGSIEIHNANGNSFDISIDTSVYGGDNAKYLDAVKVLINDEDSRIVNNYAYSDTDKQYAQFPVQIEGIPTEGLTVRAEIVAKENFNANNLLYYITDALTIGQ